MIVMKNKMASRKTDLDTKQYNEDMEVDKSTSEFEVNLSHDSWNDIEPVEKTQKKMEREGFLNCRKAGSPL